MNRWARWAPVAIASGHAAGYAGTVVWGNQAPFELFALLLLLFSIGAAVAAWHERGDALLTPGIMLLVVGHAFVGHRLAPDSLTSGAILMANVLVLYVGLKVHEKLPATHWITFVASYFLLYGIFVRTMDNAEPLFVLFLMGMVACARSLRLMTYFWALTISFTFCQPYAWVALFVSFSVLTALFGARGSVPSPTAVAFLGVGLAVFFLVLLPVIVAVSGQDLHNVELMVRDPRIRRAIGMTVVTATISTTFLLLAGVPLAYALSRLRFPGRTFVLSLVDLPIVIPQSVAGITLLHVFGRQQIIGGALHEMFGTAVDGTMLGICVAQVFVAYPFLVRTAVAAFDGVDEELEWTARTLGASSLSVFRRVSLPLALRGVFVGAVLAWARAAGEFGAVVILAPTPETAPVAAFNRFNSVGVVEAAPLVAVLLMFSMAMFCLLQWATRFLPAAAATPGRGQV